MGFSGEHSDPLVRLRGGRATMSTTPETLARAMRSYQSGNLSEAAAIYRQALSEDAANADAWCMLGIVCRARGELDEAAQAYHEALRLRPAFLEVRNNLGNVLLTQGKLDEAIACYRHVLLSRPNYAEAHNNLGAALGQQGRFEEALACHWEAVRCKPDYADAYNNLGTALTRLNRLDEALAACREALRLTPNSAAFHNGLGVVLFKLERTDEALAHYRAALALRPNFVDAHLNRGNALLAQQKFAEAEASYRAALTLKPNYPEGHANLGIALAEQGRWEEAEASYRRALSAKPDYAEALSNLGNVPAGLGRPEEALGSYEQSLRLRPDHAETHVAHALALLTLGDYLRGFAEYEWRWQTKEFGTTRLLTQPVWDGSPLEGRTILLAFEQGLGDTLQFIRYAPLVKQRGGTVIVACQQALLALLSGCAGIDRLVAHEGTLPDHDVYATLLSLPRIFGTTLETIPAQVPYLTPDAGLVERWRKEVGELADFKVGIVWQGNPQHRKDRQRSAPLSCFAPLARLPGVRLFSLQKGAGTEQLKTMPEITDLGSRLDEAAGAFTDTAAVMKHLDLIITVDTAVAHLAGALAVPVWTVLSTAPDWRWLLRREDSLWYPTMRLIRQTQAGDWDTVFRRIASELTKLAAPGNSDVVLNEAAPVFKPFNRVKSCRHGTMLYNVHDIYIGRSLDLYGEYSEGEADLFRQLLKPGMVVAEVGANIGAHTVLLAQLIGVGGRVWAFEPQRIVYQTLCANLALNSITNVDCRNVAVGREPGELIVPRLDYDRDNNFGGLGLGTYTDGERVPVVTLDSLGLRHCDLIKIDVEGMEQEVLTGATATIARCRPLLYVENDRKEKSADLVRLIAGLGYDLYWHVTPYFNAANFAKNPENVFGQIVSLNMICCPRGGRYRLDGFRPVDIPV